MSACAEKRPLQSASVLNSRNASPLLTTRNVASFYGVDVSAHSNMLTRTATVALLLAIVSVCLFGYILNFQNEIIHEFQVALLQVQWMLLLCLVVWFGTFVFLIFSLKDLPLIGLLLIAIASFFISQAASRPATDAIILLAGATLGRGTRFLLTRSSRRESAPIEQSEIRDQGLWIDQSGLTSAATFLTGLILLLAFSSCWHLDVAQNFYPGKRWTGLWDNPNTYGMLMGTGAVLAIGLLAQMWNAEWKLNYLTSIHFLQVFFQLLF